MSELGDGRAVRHRAAGASLKATVLIVDDDSQARSLMCERISEMGLTPVEAENGVAALAYASQTPPDLILLDMRMPLMSGTEILRLLKERQELRQIPVIVVSGLDETDIAAQSIDGGAEDYLTKPVNTTLLHARIRSVLERSQLRAQEQLYQQHIGRYALELEERVREKTLRLTEAHERLRILDQAKDEFLSLISHELRTPMTGVVGACDALVSGELDESSRGEAGELLRLSVERLARVVEDALLLTSIKVSADTFALEPRPLGAIAVRAADRAARLAGGRSIRIEPMADDLSWVLCQEHLLTEALASLLECAVRLSGPDQVVRMSWEKREDSVQLWIRASGWTVPRGSIPTFFEVFSIARPIHPGGDLGLGPPVAAHVLKVLGASVSLQAIDDGVLFEVVLRAAQRAAPAAADPPAGPGMTPTRG